MMPECAATTRPNDARCVDVNNGDAQHPLVRSRLVGQGARYAPSIRADNPVATSSVAPPLEALHMFLCLHMTHDHDPEDWVLVFLDIKETYLLPSAERYPCHCLQNVAFQRAILLSSFTCFTDAGMQANSLTCGWKESLLTSSWYSYDGCVSSPNQQSQVVQVWR